jgi:precorrin-3B synthase
MTVHAINRPQRRGACPGLSAPLTTGDGLLVRLTTVGTISLNAFGALCAAAQLHGNGIIEVTARGNIQIRGLNAASAPAFAATVAALDIAAADGVPIVCNPLAGLDLEEIIDASALATDLRLALARSSLAARLGAKVSVVVDGGGQLKLDGIAADVRLRAEVIDGNAMLRVGIGGDGAGATQLGTVALSEGAEAAMKLLEILAQRGRDARARDIIAAEGVAIFGEAFSSCPAIAVRRTASLRSPMRRASALSAHGVTKDVDGRAKPGHDGAGAHRLRDGLFAYGIGLPFGHTDTAALQRLIEATRTAGATGWRAAPGRTLMAIGLVQQTLPAFAAAAENLGFIVHGDDPRRHVVACAGAPICAAAEIAARALAPAVAAAAADHLDGSFKIHISGCAKGCAHSAPAALTVVGTSAGCAIVVNGSTRDAPLEVVSTNELPAAIAKLARSMNREDGHV